MRGEQLVLAGIKEIGEDAPQVEINEMRLRAEEEGALLEHELKRDQDLGQALEEFLALFEPLLEAAAPELALLEADEREPLRLGQKLLIVAVVEAKASVFNFAFDVAPQEAVHALERFGEQAEIELGGKILGDNLRVLIGFKDDHPSVANDRNQIVPLAGDAPDGGTVGVGDIDRLESHAGVFEDAPLDETERTPWDLIEFDHI